MSLFRFIGTSALYLVYTLIFAFVNLVLILILGDLTGAIPFNISVLVGLLEVIFLPFYVSSKLLRSENINVADYVSTFMGVIGLAAAFYAYHIDGIRSKMDRDFKFLYAEKPTALQEIASYKDKFCPDTSQQTNNCDLLPQMMSVLSKNPFSDISAESRKVSNLLAQRNFGGVRIITSKESDADKAFFPVSASFNSYVDTKVNYVQNQIELDSIDWANPLQDRPTAAFFLLTAAIIKLSIIINKHKTASLRL